MTSHLSQSAYQRTYERVVGELLRKDWTGERWLWTVDCAAAHRITRFIMEQRDP